MTGHFSIILHAHLPFVRHPEHEKFLEESWLYEAITETYIPLLHTLTGWQRDAIPARLTLTLTPTLCAMLNDPLLRDRYEKHLENLVDLSEKEIRRTRWDKDFHDLAKMYHEHFVTVRKSYKRYRRDLVRAFRKFQDAGMLEIITCAATHALLPLLQHPPSLRAQILVARDDYRECFGRDPVGIWLPECAYSPEVEPFLQEANLRWFMLDTHGLLRARPRPRYGVCAPVFTPNGLAAFGRDRHSAEQVWSRDIGYPGDARYRDFYRDIGYDLDFDYVKPCLPAPHVRGFTGIKYHRVTGKSAAPKQVYNRAAALAVADEHARHFLAERQKQFRRLGKIMDRPPHLAAPYDAELLGHWWYEGPEFLDRFVRHAVKQDDFVLSTPAGFLREHATHQVAAPATSSWGEEGHWRVWLNEKNEWIYPHLRVAQERMTLLAQKFSRPKLLVRRALKQAARELLLAQASDWPFILRTGTHAEYARQRVENHLLRFNRLHDQLCTGKINQIELKKIESVDNVFAEVDPGYWRPV